MKNLRTIEAALLETQDVAFYLQVDLFMAEEHDKAFNYDSISRRKRNLLADEVAQFDEYTWEAQQ